MKKIFLTCALAFSFFASAQTFTGSGPVSIQDNQTSWITVTVTGLASSIDTSFGLCQVCVDITHTYDGDLDIYLVSPANDSIILSNNQGGQGNNYTNTCFIMSASNSIVAGAAPYTGSYRPENSLNTFNDGQNPNGLWRVCVRDEAPADVGTINSVSINFCSNPPPDPIVTGPCAINNGAGCLCPDGTQDCDLLPDMLASADIIAQQHAESPGLFELSNATPNVGWGPMEIHSSGSCWCDTVNVPCSTSLCPNGQPPKEKLLQRIYHKNNGTITWHDTLTPGTMSYHPTHGHVHVDNWAWFSLRQATSNPDATTWPVIASGSKVSFCLINLGDCTSDYGYCRDMQGNVITMADVPNSPFGVVSGCGADQGIYTGMLDIYSIGLPDMYIDLTGVCNGNYYIVSITDPDNNFIETNDSNNWVAVPVTLTQQQAAPSAAFNFTPFGMSYAFSANTSSNVTSFEWDFGDGSTDTLNNPTIHNFSTPGTYTVTFTINGPCGTFTTTQIISVTGVEESADFAKSALTAYPNPANGSTMISYLVPENGKVQLELYNLLGERVASLYNGEQAEGKYSLPIDFAALGLRDGNYVVRLVTDRYNAALRVTCAR